MFVLYAYLPASIRAGDPPWPGVMGLAGLQFVGIVFLRIIVAAVRREPVDGWRSYLVMIVLSPFWIPMIYDLLLPLFVPKSLIHWYQHAGC